MTTPTAEQLRELDQRAQAFAPKVAMRRPSTFLSLAPDLSESYPRVQQSKQPKPEPLATAAVPEPAVRDNETDASKRRTSSLGSDGKSPTSRRFLKLGPVHWGEHQEDHQADWHEAAVE